ncbi:hypothetical protein DPMN_029582 [Dreissena polymorpha]|uniref:Uncharacterized protein n=1 Tax=Dreissena polymorpha TaxID=45954 RepID=A0A9D4LWQ1_DREPO|nr:hypothetical protein DPMN_029582 [Dreissena polymorpha]
MLYDMSSSVIEALERITSRHVWLFHIEVGARRLSAQSVCLLMLAVECTGRNRRQTIRKPSKAP